LELKIVLIANQIADYSCKGTTVRDSAISVNVAQYKQQEVWKNSKLSFNYDKLDVSGNQVVYLEHVIFLLSTLIISKHLRYYWEP